MATKKTEITSQDIQRAIALKHEVPLGLDKEEKQRIEALLNHQMTLNEFLDAVDTVMYPSLIKIAEMENNWLVIQEVLDKMGMTKEQWDDSVKDVKEADAKAREDLRKQMTKGDPNENKKD